jgi:Uma2 family endonuclease
MMTTATATTDRITEADGDQCVELRDIDWKGYSALLRMRGEQSVPRMIYRDGSVILVSPSCAHEHFKERLGRLVTEIVRGFKIPCNPSGQTTFRRHAKRGGVEGDLTYYLANEARIRGKRRINLREDPPPDLAIEVAVTHDPADAVEVYRRFRVPEVWICDERGLTILVLQPDGRYAQSDRSLAFPFITAEEIGDWIHRPQSGSETEWLDQLHDWVRDVLVPRVRRPEGGA